MEVAGWALLGFLPAVVDRHGIFSFVAPLIALSIVAARLSLSKNVFFKLLLVNALLFYPVLGVVGTIFAIDPRSVDIHIADYLPMPVATRNPSSHSSATVVIASVVWACIFGGIAVTGIEKTHTPRLTVSWIRGWVAVGVFSYLHIYFWTYSNGSGYTPRRTEIITGCASAYSLMLLHPAFFLALFHSYFPKRAAKLQDAINEK